MSPEAPPRARDARRADKPLSPLASLGVAALTGAAVFAAGVHAVERRWPDLAAPPSASEALPAASEALPAASEAPPAASEAPPAASAAP
ncbi:MAG: hypothetical protein IT372_04395, partial [Polyangiaceae bacterium]|nr:hypothetical protein [Polyangiaceae bacterium]